MLKICQSASHRTFFQSSFDAKDLMSPVFIILVSGFGTSNMSRKTGEEGICMSSCAHALCVVMRFSVLREFGSALDIPLQKSIYNNYTPHFTFSLSSECLEFSKANRGASSALSLYGIYLARSNLRTAFRRCPKDRVGNRIQTANRLDETWHSKRQFSCLVLDGNNPRELEKHDRYDRYDS